VRRLSRYEPVSNNNSSRHRQGAERSAVQLHLCNSTIFPSGSRAYTIRRTPTRSTSVVTMFPNCAADGRNHCLQRLVYIVHRKGDVTEPALVRGRQFRRDQLIIAENFKRRTIVTVAGQSQMNAAKMSVLKKSQLIQPGTGHVALRRLRLASEDLGIESNQSFPISGNQICVNVLGADWHYRLLC
jgi:hypothetical protein